MLAKITDKTAWTVAFAGLAVSLVGAALAPQEEKLGDWLKLVVWHGMLKWAIIVTIFAMGALALARLLARKDAAEKWAQAMQLVTLPFWVFAVLVGAISAKLVWGGWNLTERRMVMSTLYIIAAAVLLIVGLFWEKRGVIAWSALLTALAMGALLAWIALAPAGDDIHPQGAVWSSTDPVIWATALMMMGGNLLWVLGTVVPARRWLERMHKDEG